MSQNVLGYTNLTYQEIKERIDELLKAGDYKNFSQSSVYKIFLDILTAQFDMINYYIERRAEETYLDTAKLKSSIIALSRMLGYDITRPRPASVEISIKIKNPNFGRSDMPTLVGNTLLIPKFTKLIGPNNLPFFVSENITYFVQRDKPEYNIRFKSLNTVFLEEQFFQENKVKPIYAIQGLFKDVQIKATDYPELINKPFASIELNDQEFSDLYGENDEGYDYDDTVYYTSLIPSIQTISGSVTGSPISTGTDNSQTIKVSDIFNYNNGYSFTTLKTTIIDPFRNVLTGSPNSVTVSYNGSTEYYNIPNIFNYKLDTTSTKKFKNFTRLIKYNVDNQYENFDNIFYYDVTSDASDLTEFSINRFFISDPSNIKNPYYIPLKETDTNIILPSAQVKTTANGGVEFIFGDGISSQKAFLDQSDILYLRYFSTQGSRGNFTSFLDTRFSVVDSNSIKWYDDNGSEISTAANVEFIIKSASSGGSDIESDESIKNNASSNYSTKGRLVTKKDYKEFFLNSVFNEYGRSIRNAIVWSEQDELKFSRAVADKRFSNTILFSVIGSLYYIDNNGKYISPLKYNLTDVDSPSSNQYSTIGEENCVIDGKYWYDLKQRFFEIFDIYTTVDLSDPNGASKYNGVNSAIAETEENSDTTGKFLYKMYNSLNNKGMITTKHCYISPIILDIAVNGKIYVDRLTDKSKVQHEINDAIYRWADSNIDFNTKILRSEIVSILSRVPGVKYIDDIYFDGLDKRTQLPFSGSTNTVKFESTTGNLVGFNHNGKSIDLVTSIPTGMITSTMLLKKGILLKTFNSNYSDIFYDNIIDNVNNVQSRYDLIKKETETGSLGISFFEKLSDSNDKKQNLLIVKTLNCMFDELTYYISKNLIDVDGNISRYTCMNEVVKLVNNIEVTQI